MRFRPSVAVLAFAAAAALGAPGTARADVKTVKDGNDVSSRLDIRSASHGHAGARFVTHTVTTFGSFSSSSLGAPNGFTFQFANHGTNRFTRFVFVGWRNGRLSALVANRTTVIGRAAVSRPNSRTVKVKIPIRLLDPLGYRWLVASFFGSGFDVAPNRRLIVHDLAGPKITRLAFPNPTTNASDTLTFPASFSLRDGSGIRSWEIERRLLGTAAWTTVAQGRGANNTSAMLAGVEGETYEFRVRATDRAGNTTVSPIKRVSVPLDDANAAFASAYSGIWNGGNDGYLATLHWTSASEGVPGTFTYTFTGTYFAWISNTTNPVGGSATVTIDSVSHMVDLTSGQGRRKVVFSKTLSAGSHTVTIATLSGTFSIDAIVAR